MAKKAQRPKITKEVAELGKQVEKALREVATSDELRDIGSDISSSFRRIGEKVVNALQAAKKSGHGQEVGDQLKKVVGMGKASGKETADRVRENLQRGLRGVGEELARIAERLDKR